MPRPPRPLRATQDQQSDAEGAQEQPWVLYIERDSFRCEEAMQRLHDLMKGLPVTLRVEDITSQANDPYLESVPILEDPDGNIVWIEYFDLERTWEAWVAWLSRNAHKQRPTQAHGGATATVPS